MSCCASRSPDDDDDDYFVATGNKIEAGSELQSNQIIRLPLPLNTAPSFPFEHVGICPWIPGSLEISVVARSPLLIVSPR